MSSSHIQLLLIIGGAMALVSALHTDRPMFWPFLLGGCTLLALSFYFYRIERRK